MSEFTMSQASKVVRFLANDKTATWEPTSDGGVTVHHDDYDETFTKQHFVEANKNFAYEISKR